MLPHGVQFAAFQNLQDGRAACAAHRAKRRLRSKCRCGPLGAAAEKVRIYQTFRPPVLAALPAAITLDPERVVFVVEAREGDEPASIGPPSLFRRRGTSSIFRVRIGRCRGAKLGIGGRPLSGGGFRPPGTIVRIRDKRGQLELLQEPRLADNFRFSLPIRGSAAWQSTEANYVLGKDQLLSGIAGPNTDWCCVGTVH